MVETKLKNSKVIVAVFVTDDYPDSYWGDQSYSWFSRS
jgi:DMSO/TMAO reductase YedYZ molybdopterin-dependent catalytic subunit